MRGLLNWPGIPALPDYARALFDFVWFNFEIDEDFFVDHPVDGGPVPPTWVISVRPIDSKPPLAPPRLDAGSDDRI